MENNIKDLVTGVIFIGAGSVFLLSSLSLPLGSIVNMGPGFMPATVSALLIAVGGLIILRSLFWKS